MNKKSDGRDDNGQFANGNPGGPGRPRRAIEREYLVALNEIVRLDAWTKIVEKAVADATAGDWRAREWLSRYLLGENPPSLLALAASDLISRSAADDEIRKRVERLKDEAFGIPPRPYGI